MNINERIRKVRKDNNLTQEEFAEIINVSRSTVALYEKGIRKPDINIIDSICKYFNLSIDEFYDVSTQSNKRISKMKIIIVSFLTILLVLSSIVASNFIRVTNMYGYNIYNDELKVKNSTDICIVRINEKISETENEVVYSINYMVTLKRSSESKKNIYRRININNNINIDVLKIYIIFHNNNNKYLENETEGYYDCDAKIQTRYFIEELSDYDESLSYNEQAGKSKKIIDYYLNIINKNK